MFVSDHTLLERVFGFRTRYQFSSLIALPDTEHDVLLVSPIFSYFLSVHVHRRRFGWRTNRKKWHPSHPHVVPMRPPSRHFQSQIGTNLPKPSLSRLTLPLFKRSYEPIACVIYRRTHAAPDTYCTAPGASGEQLYGTRSGLKTPGFLILDGEYVPSTTALCPMIRAYHIQLLCSVLSKICS